LTLLLIFINLNTGFTIKAKDMILRMCLLVYLLCIQLQSGAQAGWQLNKDKNGIKVYTKASDTTSYKSIKVEGVFTGTWEKLFTILMDITHHPLWVYNAKRSYLIKKIAGNEVLYYTETSLPWPMNNRDVVVRMKIFPDSELNVYKVISTGEPNAIPAKNGLVRIPYYKATWEVKPLEKQKIAITYYLDIHPGGSAPAWVVNMFITTGPFETFNKLAELLKK
jgi:hypothetical protein